MDRAALHMRSETMYFATWLRMKSVLSEEWRARTTDIWSFYRRRTRGKYGKITTVSPHETVHTPRVTKIPKAEADVSVQQAMTT